MKGVPVAVQPIRLFGDPVLRTPAEPVETFDKELRKLVADLTDTMREAPGSGLAAPQIGVSLRVFTWWVDDELGHLCNPQLDLSDEIQDGEEGCLSIPDLAFETPRAWRVVAFDFGVKRIGVAIGTLLGAGQPGPARALTTIDTESNDARFTTIAALIAEWQP